MSLRMIGASTRPIPKAIIDAVCSATNAIAMMGRENFHDRSINWDTPK